MQQGYGRVRRGKGVHGEVRDELKRMERKKGAHREGSGNAGEKGVHEEHSEGYTGVA